MLNDLCNSEALKAGKDLVSPMFSLQQRLINFLINFINLILILSKLRQMSLRTSWEFIEKNCFL